MILLSASTTTGKTIHRSLEGIRYYGGVIEAVASVFSTVSEMDGFAVHSVFHAEDLPGYAAYSADDCPFCKKESSWMPWSMDSVILSYDQK